MSIHNDTKYACPQCGSDEFVTQPDSYAVYCAEGDSLGFSRTVLTNDEFRLSCRECGEAAPEAFLAAAH